MAERVYKSRRLPREKRLWHAPKGVKSFRSRRRPPPPPSARSSSPFSARWLPGCRVPGSCRPWTSTAAAAASKRPALRARVEERRRRPRLLPARCGFASFPIKRRGRVEAALPWLLCIDPTRGMKGAFFPAWALGYPNASSLFARVGCRMDHFKASLWFRCWLRRQEVESSKFCFRQENQPTLQDCCGENRSREH